MLYSVHHEKVQIVFIVRVIFNCHRTPPGVREGQKGVIWMTPDGKKPKEEEEVHHPSGITVASSYSVNVVFVAVVFSVRPSFRSLYVSTCCMWQRCRVEISRFLAPFRLLLVRTPSSSCTVSTGVYYWSIHRTNSFTGA